jgi:hypothetical protein
MDRRAFWMTALGTAAAGLAATAQGAAQKSAPPGAAHAHNEQFQKCAQACNDCQRMCAACATHCAGLLAEGKKDHLTTLRTCLDCADFCVAAAQIVARGGPFADLICTACADACARCGKECERFASDKMMKECAEECRRCEKACREMLHHLGHATPGKQGQR